MIPIKHILQENGVKEIFKLIVPSGSFQGEYIIDKPGGWDDVDSVVNIDDESMNVVDFIIGNNTKLKFYQEKSKIAYNLLKNVYAEQQGDGRIIFKYIGVKDGVEFDLLKDNFEVNMNKYSHSYDKFYFKIEVELIKSESQNKLINRDDVTIDLFAEKDLDDNHIDPVETFVLGYKKGDATLSNFYVYSIPQNSVGNNASSSKFFAFTRSDGFGFGGNTNSQCGIENIGNSPFQVDYGPFVSTNVTLKLMTAEISNFDINARTSGGNFYPNIRLLAVIKNGGTVVKTIELKTYQENPAGSIHYSRITIDNETFDIGDLNQGESLHFEIKDINGGDFILFGLKENTSIELKTNLEAPLSRTRGIRLIAAFDQIVRNITSSELSVVSNFIGPNGVYYNTSISTGLFIRGIPNLFLNNKLKTSFKKLFNEGVAKLLVMGYDIIDHNVVIEDLGYFFKDVKSYDLSNKKFLQDGYKFENDKDIIFNTLVFGSKKISSKNKDDLRNFVTTAEFTTTIKNTKNKLDKQTELIIDEYKIKDIIEDSSYSTNESDDDLILIDIVDEKNYYDEGVYEKCVHSNEGGNLVLKCLSKPFDTTMIQVNYFIEIVQGINKGTYLVLSINGAKMTLSTNIAIESGVSDTAIRNFIPFVTKNRTSEGFTETSNIQNINVATNVRHNPKYHMARWFQWFGSGLRKKQNGEFIKVTSYKNNEKAQMKTNSPDLINELQGLIEVGANEPLSRLRNYKTPFFSGDLIEIKYVNITFQEFIMMYENWRHGISGDRLTSRGYITLNTPAGIYDAYPFGDAALSHDRKTNVLSFKGKIKSKSAENPVLLSVIQNSKDTVVLHWDYGTDYIAPTIDVQYSIDGVNWVTLRQFYNVKQGTIIDDVFTQILSETNVSFRLIVNTLDFINKISNTIAVEWKFNPYVIIARSKSENTDCGYSKIVFDLKGKADFEIEYSYGFMPSGGKLWATNLNGTGGNLVVETAYGLPTIDGVETRNISIDGDEARLFIDLFNSDKTETLLPLNCTFGDYQYTCYANVTIKFTDTITNASQIFDLKAETIKLYS